MGLHKGTSGECRRGVRARLKCRVCQDILEAFLAHPKIGDSKGAKDHGGKWASNEQKGMQNASSGITAAMAQGNADYEAKMGFR